MPLRCSFFGKVPPIGGFRVPYGFLPPTLPRGGICAFCTSAILRRYGLISDFVSCSVWLQYIRIRRRRIGQAFFCWCHAVHGFERFCRSTAF